MKSDQELLIRRPDRTNENLRTIVESPWLHVLDWIRSDSEPPDGVSYTTVPLLRDLSSECRLKPARHVYVREFLVCERFHKTIQDEFYSVAFRKKLYSSLDQLQTDLDIWLEEYNEHRPHSGKYCFGKTPMQTFLDARHLAHEKELDRVR